MGDLLDLSSESVLNKMKFFAILALIGFAEAIEFVWLPYSISSDSPVNPVAITDRDCKTLKNDVLRQPSTGYLCFSRKPVTRCNKACYPRENTVRRVSYACLRGWDPRAEKYLAEIQKGQVVRAPESLPEDFAQEEEMPLECAHGWN